MITINQQHLHEDRPYRFVATCSPCLWIMWVLIVVRVRATTCKQGNPVRGHDAPPGGFCRERVARGPDRRRARSHHHWPGCPTGR